MGRKKRDDEKPDQKEPTPPPTKVEKFTSDLKVQLTPQEVAERAERAAELLAERDHKEEELKAHQKHVKSQIATVEAEMRVLSSEVRLKHTIREVECERRYIFAENVVQEVRLDTGEVITTRPMSDREKQPELPFGKKKDGDGLDDAFGGDDEDGGEDEPDDKDKAAE